MLTEAWPLKEEVDRGDSGKGGGVVEIKCSKMGGVTVCCSDLA